MNAARAGLLAPAVFWSGLDPNEIADRFVPQPSGYLPPQQRVARITERLKEVADLATEINHRIARLDF